MTTPRPPLILFPGMGADERLFAPQREAFPDLIVPPWLPPTRGEPLTDYAARFAKVIDPHTPCFVGGASFGGFVALEVARHLQAKACLLIGSAQSPNELPLRIRSLRGVSRLLPAVPFEWAAPFARLSGSASGWVMPPATRGTLRQLTTADPAFLRWACAAVLSWRFPGPPPGVPIFHIHGRRDRIIPVARTRADTIVDGAGHLLSLTHPTQVNRFLAEKMAALSAHSPS